MLKIKQAKIMIVDDENLVLKAYSRELQNAGYHVTTAASGKEALELLRQESFDIVYVDLVMPEMNGVDLCKAIKEVSPDTEVVLISANPGEILKYQRDFWQAGGRDEILRKPLAEDELTNVTLVVLREKHGKN